jgi:hypothetical protein
MAEATGLSTVTYTEISRSDNDSNAELCGIPNCRACFVFLARRTSRACIQLSVRRMPTASGSINENEF